MPRLAIIAALPRELAPLSRDLRATSLSHAEGILVQSATIATQTSPILLVTAGMGQHRAALAFEAALAQGSVDTILNVGLAGACDPLLQPGTVVQASLIIDSRSGERFVADAHLDVASRGILVTSPQIASPAEKRRLLASYNAAVVDMEAAALARLADAHHLRFGALKAVSDEHHVDLKPLSAFSDWHGHFRTGAFALHTAVRPRRWRPIAVLGRNTKLALVSLTAAIHQVLSSTQ